MYRLLEALGLQRSDYRSSVRLPNAIAFSVVTAGGKLVKRRAWVGAGALAVFVALLSFAPVLDRLVLFPSTRPIDPADAVRRRLLFQGGELEVWIARSVVAEVNGRADTFVLRFYGNADRPERWVAAEANMLGARALEVWGVNYPGFGGSTGPSRLARIGPAALAAFDEMKRTAGKRPIVVSGTSFGTIAALHLAAEREFAGVILHNPPPLREMIIQDHGWWNLWILAGPLSRKVPAAVDSLTNARRARAPAAFLLAERDAVVRPKFQRLIVDAYAGEKRIIPLAGADHLSPLDRAALASLNSALEWMVPEQRRIAHSDGFCAGALGVDR